MPFGYIVSGPDGAGGSYRTYHFTDSLGQPFEDEIELRAKESLLQEGQDLYVFEYEFVDD